MTAALFAFAPGFITSNILIDVVIIAAAVALVYVALTQFGLTIPPWVMKCFWIVVVAVVVIFCIRLVMSL